MGTLLTVRLNNRVAADHPGPSDIFKAVLDEPIRIGGKVIVPKGSLVSGHIGDAQISVKKDRGLIRLDLQSIDIRGREFPVQTASLFTRTSSGSVRTDGGANGMILEKGRRLTFRLTEPVDVATQGENPAR